MRGYNKIILCGNVGGDPNVREFENGDKKVDFSLATREGGYTTTRGTQVPEVTLWHRVVVSGRQAEVAAKYVRKGQGLLVEGRLNYREYTNKDGQKVQATEIIASALEFVDRKEAQADTQTAASVQGNGQGEAPAQDRAMLEKIAERMTTPQSQAAARDLFGGGNDLPF